MRKPNIGMVGLGNIAQKAYLPILSKETDWNFIGAFSPNKEKRKKVCKQYRINEFSSVLDLTQNCDAVFVHSSTSSHYEVVSKLLKSGKDVYVDKPLAATVEEAEKLVELSERHARKLMVGFNRRFAPMYVKAKAEAKEIAWIRIDKHRMNSVGPQSYEFTILDDYLHLIDTARWLSDGDLNITNGHIQVNDENQLLHTHHCFASSQGSTVTTAMHRSAGTNSEQIELVTNGTIIRVKNMHTIETEQENTITASSPPSWETTLKQRGFEGSIYHFIQCIIDDKQPVVDGFEGLKSQMLIEKLLRFK
jgi:virulence factor